MPNPEDSSLRRERRSAFSGRIRITWQDPGSAPHFSYANGINISRSGLAFLADEEIPVRTIVGFEIPKTKLKASGSVRYCRRKGLKQIIGIEFTGSFHWNPETSPIPGL